MTRTMTANIPGARLREAERQLAVLRGEDAINAFMEEHPTEVRILEQMVTQRRAGKPVPSLARVQRVMLWSDGEIEFATEAPGAAVARPERPERRGPVRGGDRQARGPGGGGPAGQSAQARGGAAPWGSQPRRETPAGGAARPASGRGASAAGRDPGFSSGPPRQGGTGRRTGAGGRSAGGRDTGRQGGRRSFGDDTMRGMPRSGEGWVLLREGEIPPDDRPHLFEAEAFSDEQETEQGGERSADSVTPESSTEGENGDAPMPPQA